MENKQEVSVDNTEKTTTTPAPVQSQNQKTIFTVVAVAVLVLLSILVWKFPPQNEKTLNPEDAKIKAEEFINNNLMLPGTKATITSVEEENGLYKLSVNVGMDGEEEIIESYINKAGTLFYPQAFDVDEYVNPYLGELDIDWDDIDWDDIDWDDIDLEDLEFNGEELE